MDIEGAWNMGFSGKGVKVAVLNDGLEYTHPEIEKNYSPNISYDFTEDDDDPLPRFTLTNLNRHGTRCVGQIVAKANNSRCCVGIAQDVQIGMLKVLDGPSTDASESQAVSFKNDEIDIYSSSWGPDDNGEKVDGPGLLTISAMVKGVQHGRQGRGSIFVWAAGNGGRYNDDCNCDGYCNSPFSISVNSISEKFIVPSYTESCASALTSTFSSDRVHDRQIVTTELGGGCTMRHSGTSASAPIVAAAVALALEANPSLTWRDVQHLIVHSSFHDQIKSKNRRKNGAGHHFDDACGFGLLNVKVLVAKALNWNNVPERHSCAVLAHVKHVRIPANRTVVARMNTKSCDMLKSLEHVESVLTIDSQRRGRLSIVLMSPMGTRSKLLRKRLHDMSNSGYYNWPFTSVQFWGENPTGEWTIEIHNEDHSDAFFTQWLTVFHGF
ncbi:hypothetical protein ACOME3_003803 [Neoechinorhynchus agilis]